MADYTSYTTDAIILSRASRGEHDITVTCLTRSLGIVSAVSRSARKETSRQRYGLSVGSQSTLTLVRGRQWRITSVIPGQTANFGSGVAASWKSVIKTVETVLPKNIDDSRLFEIVADITTTANALQSRQIPSFECWAQARVLQAAGFFDSVPGYDPESPFLAAEGQLQSTLTACQASMHRGLHALGILMK